MEDKRKNVDYSELIARAAEEEKAAGVDGETASFLVDDGVDYESEYRKQTGRDFATGEIVVQ